MSSASAVQTFSRASLILDVLSKTRDGARFSEISKATGFGKGTAHRLLSGLVSVGFIDKDAGTKRYMIGARLAMIGAASTHTMLINSARPAMARLAEATDDTVFLSVKSGAHAVCIHREIGAFPIKTLTLDVGDARPLGIGAGSLAILAALSDMEVAAIIMNREADRSQYSKFSAAKLEAAIEKTRKSGFALNDGKIVPEMSAVGMAVRDKNGELVGALSVAAIKERMAPKRMKEVVKALNIEALSLSPLLQRSTGSEH